jgi:hypothetical protein
MTTHMRMTRCHLRRRRRKIRSQPLCSRQHRVRAPPRLQRPPPVASPLLLHLHCHVVVIDMVMR